jgi:hypothetical protein
MNPVAVLRASSTPQTAHTDNPVAIAEFRPQIADLLHGSALRKPLETGTIREDRDSLATFLSH